jgi:hypothetical protein
MVRVGWPDWSRNMLKYGLKPESFDALSPDEKAEWIEFLEGKREPTPLSPDLFTLGLFIGAYEDTELSLANAQSVAMQHAAEKPVEVLELLPKLANISRSSMKFFGPWPDRFQLLADEDGEKLSSAVLRRMRAKVCRARPDLTGDGLAALRLPEAYAILTGQVAQAVKRLEPEICPDPPGATSTKSPFQRTVDGLAGFKRMIEIVTYLWAKEGRKAALSEIARDVYRTRAQRKNWTKSTRTQVERTRSRLENDGLPLRLNIDGGMVSLVDAPIPHGDAT